MARKRKTDMETNGAVAVAVVPMALSAEAPVEPRPEPEPEGPPPPPRQEPPSNGNRPVHVLTYLIGNDTYAQVQIWKRVVNRRDGSEFTTYDVSLRKRWLDQRDGAWKTLYSFSASELYAVHHGLEQAARWVAETRAAEDVPF